MSSLRPVRGTPREVYALLRDWHSASEDPGPLMVETSGSTGEPKRVVLSRAAMRASADATHGRLGGAGQWLLDLPATHVAGLQVLFRSVLAGSEPVVRAEHESFRAAAAAMTGPRRYLSLVPTQLTRMLASPPDVDALRAFDAVLVGGAAMDRRLRREAVDAGVRVVATYGMSETCGGCVYDGFTLDRVAVAIDTDGRIRIGGPVLFEGYDGAPGLTAAVKRDGWFLTSDLGRLDQDGRLQVLGRIDDVVISGGVNVPAAAVAARLREHPEIDAAEVIGVPDEEWGQRVVAIVVNRAGVAPRNVPPLDALRNWVSRVLPRAWAPRQLIRTPEIPLLPNGKIDRLTLERIATGELQV